MLRRVTLSAIFFLLPLGASAQDAGAVSEAPADTIDEAEVLESIDSETVDEENEEEEYYEEEFCGGGDESLVDSAYYAVESDDPESAIELLVPALQTGGIEEWERTRALVILADAQLALGQLGRAIANYRRALSEAPAEVGAWGRVQLANALLQRHRSAEAYALASENLASACADRYQFSACYVAHAVMAESAPLPEARAAAREAITALRTQHADYDYTFDAIDQRMALDDRDRS